MNVLRAIFVFFLLSALPLAAQFASDSLFSLKSLRFGFDKTGSTFLFRGDLSGNFTLPVGSLFLQQRYRGRTILGLQTSTRDDEDVLVQYRLPVSDYFTLLSSNSAQISDDSHSIGLNRLQNWAFFGGTKYEPNKEFTAELSAGGERNQQIGIADNGWGIFGKSAVVGQKFEDYQLDGNFDGRFDRLGNRRTNGNSNISLRLFTASSANERLEITVQHGLMHRDNYTPVDSASPNKQDSIESRQEQQIKTGVLFAFPLVSFANIELHGSLEDLRVHRNFRNYNPGNLYSAADRNLDQLRLSYSGVLKLNFERSSHSIGFFYESRSETNNVGQRFQAGIDSLRQSEANRDNSSTRFSLFEQSAWRIFSSDSLQFSGSSAILRYDTPSLTNYDDRDEFSASASMVYSHRFSPLLVGALTAETQISHIIFLKAERSAQNNWNRIFRFSPALCIKSKNFEANPQFEVLANYTSYDFEDIGASAQSFSFRQAAYRDSIVVRLNSDRWLESGISIRYYERGEFRWNSFSEKPTDRNYENFITTLYFSNMSKVFKFGMGVRYYALMTKQISMSDEYYLHQSIGPETHIQATMESGIWLRIRGWYDIYFENKVQTKQLPTIYFDVGMKF